MSIIGAITALTSAQIASFNQKFKDEMDMLMMQQSSIDPPILRYEPEPPAAPSSCPGCGSRETIIHMGRSRCAYCRGDR